MKRCNETSSPKRSKIIADFDRKVASQYHGYRPTDKHGYIDAVELPSTEQGVQSFFNNYVVARRPCKIIGVLQDEFPDRNLKPNSIAGFLPRDEILTVETKVDGGFGSGAKRIKMTFGQFMDKLAREKNAGLYLTTQYYEDDPNASEDTDEEERDQVLSECEDDDSVTFEDLHDDFDELEEQGGEDTEEHEMRLRELYQPPLNNLVGTLPEVPAFLHYLIPQQINLWVGSSSTACARDEEWLNKFDAKGARLGLGRNVPGGGTSSGLHHDHSDNLYIPVAGHKRFTLFAPSDAAKMYTVGNIRQVYASGVIDYIPDDRAPLWRQLRDDGAIVTEVYQHLLEKRDRGTETLDAAQAAQYEKLMELDRRRHNQEVPPDLDPPSFSTIPPAVVHLDKVQDKKLRESIARASELIWPLFNTANRLTVDLKPGEMLYLPTGWFHEVTSFGDGDDSGNDNANDPDTGDVHIAVNYWFVPPTGKTMNNVYDHEDGYWPHDYELTKEALEWARKRTE